MKAWPDAVDERNPARLLDRPRHGPARADVVDHLRARLLRQHRLREERRDEVARDELAGVVDEEAAVGIAVVCDAEVGPLRPRLLDDERAVLGQQRVRLVVRERPVRLEVALDDVELRQPLEHRREHRPGHSVGRVDDDAERPDRPPRRRTRAPSRRSRPRRPLPAPRRGARPSPNAGARHVGGPPRARSRRRRAARRGGRSSCPCTPSGCARR